MSWQKITRPLTMDIDPEIVKIGKLALEVYERENKPAGFGMFHATRGSEGGLNDTRLVYLTPVAAELCRESLADYELEACEPPARDEPKMMWVFGDPLTMGLLKEHFEPEPGSWEYDWAQQLAAHEAALLAEAEAARAELEAAQAEATQADSAQA